MTPEAFVKKWTGVALTERSAAQQHFLDLCALVGHPAPAEADPAGEWFTFERGAEKCRRAGLLATQGIRGGANREVLKRIKQSGEIFFVISDREWILDGANVHVSMMGFEGRDGSPSRPKIGALGEDALPILDGRLVSEIHANLSADAKAASELKKRTLTNLYNQRPAWLANAHAALDAAVADAYGLAPDLGEPEILARLLERNLATAPPSSGEGSHGKH